MNSDVGDLRRTWVNANLQGEENENFGAGNSNARIRGLAVADTVFFRCARGDFDVVVAQYHDQGHIAVKQAGLEHGVNLTAGLPFFRVSVDHGTAFDIAWQGRASDRSMTEAILLAAELAGAGANP